MTEAVLRFRPCALTQLMKFPTSSNCVMRGGRPASTTKIEPAGLDNALRSSWLKPLVNSEKREGGDTFAPFTTIEPCKNRSVTIVLTS